MILKYFLKYNHLSRYVNNTDTSFFLGGGEVGCEWEDKRSYLFSLCRISDVGTSGINLTFGAASHLRFICYILASELFKRKARSEFLIQL